MDSCQTQSKDLTNQETFDLLKYRLQSLINEKENSCELRLISTLHPENMNDEIQQPDRVYPEVWNRLNAKQQKEIFSLHQEAKKVVQTMDLPRHNYYTRYQARRTDPYALSTPSSMYTFGQQTEPKIPVAIYDFQTYDPRPKYTDTTVSKPVSTPVQQPVRLPTQEEFLKMRKELDATFHNTSDMLETAETTLPELRKQAQSIQSDPNMTAINLQNCVKLLKKSIKYTWKGVQYYFIFQTAFNVGTTLIALGEVSLQPENIATWISQTDATGVEEFIKQGYNFLATTTYAGATNKFVQERVFEIIGSLPLKALCTVPVLKHAFEYTLPVGTVEKWISSFGEYIPVASVSTLVNNVKEGYIKHLTLERLQKKANLSVQQVITSTVDFFTLRPLFAGYNLLQPWVKSSASKLSKNMICLDWAQRKRSKLIEVICNLVYYLYYGVLWAQMVKFLMLVSSIGIWPALTLFQSVKSFFNGMKNTILDQFAIEKTTWQNPALLPQTLETMQTAVGASFGMMTDAIDAVSHTVQTQKEIDELKAQLPQCSSSRLSWASKCTNEQSLQLDQINQQIKMKQEQLYGIGGQLEQAYGKLEGTMPLVAYEQMQNSMLTQEISNFVMINTEGKLQLGQQYETTLTNFVNDCKLLPFSENGKKALADNLVHDGQKFLNNVQSNVFKSITQGSENVNSLWRLGLNESPLGMSAWVASALGSMFKIETTSLSGMAVNNIMYWLGTGGILNDLSFILVIMSILLPIFFYILPKVVQPSPDDDLTTLDEEELIDVFSKLYDENNKQTTQTSSLTPDQVSPFDR